MQQSDVQKKINEIILKAKIGDSVSIHFIKDMYGFVFDQMFEIFVEIYDFLVYQKGLMAKEFYECLIECIEDYKFKDNVSFGYMLKMRYIVRIQKLLIVLYSLKDESIAKQKTICYNIKNKKSKHLELRKEVLLCLKNLDREFKYIFFLRMYLRLKYHEIMVILKPKEENTIEYAKVLCGNMYKEIIDLFSEHDPGSEMGICRKIDTIYRITDVKKNKWLAYLYHKY